MTIVPHGSAFIAFASSATPSRNSRAATPNAAIPMLTLQNISRIIISSTPHRAMICFELNLGRLFFSMGLSGVLTL